MFHDTFSLCFRKAGIKNNQTFTEKAAKELVTRITNELSARNIVVNINDMYIGTFHSLCLRIIKEHLEYTHLKRSYRTLDAFDQSYMVFQNINKFKAIATICQYVQPKYGVLDHFIS